MGNSDQLKRLRASRYLCVFRLQSDPKFCDRSYHGLKTWDSLTGYADPLVYNIYIYILMSCYFDYNCCSVYKAPPNRQKSSSIVLSPSSSPVRLIAHTRHTDINHNVFKYTAVAEVSMDRRQWTLCASNECFRYLPMRRQHPHPACTYNGSVLLLLYYFYYCTHTYLTRGMSHIDVRGQR